MVWQIARFPQMIPRLLSSCTWDDFTIEADPVCTKSELSSPSPKDSSVICLTQPAGDVKEGREQMATWFIFLLQGIKPIYFGGQFQFSFSSEWNLFESISGSGLWSSAIIQSPSHGKIFWGVKVLFQFEKSMWNGIKLHLSYLGLLC